MEVTQKVSKIDTKTKSKQIKQKPVSFTFKKKRFPLTHIKNYLNDFILLVCFFTPWGDQKTNGIERPVTLKELEKPVTELANDIGKTKEPFYFTFDYFQIHLPNGQRYFQHHFLHWAPESFLQQFQLNVWVCLTTPN